MLRRMSREPAARKQTKNLPREEMYAMLKIGEDFVFEEDWSRRQSSLMYFEGDEDESPSWSVEIGFARGNFNGEEISPSICINPIATDQQSAADLAGQSFSVRTVEESYDREDSFYIYEHEPMVDYALQIVEIKSDTAHIKCSGTLIVDGYARPYTTAGFEIDSWVPIIESVQDWQKFGL